MHEILRGIPKKTCRVIYLLSDKNGPSTLRYTSTTTTRQRCHGQPRTLLHVSTMGRVHAAHAAAIVDATAPTKRATRDIGAEATDLADEGSSVLAPVGELVGAEEYKEE